MSGRGIAAFVLAAMLLPAAASAQERRTILDPLPESRPAAAAQVVAGGVPLSPQGLTQISEKALAFELRRIDFEIEMLRHAEAAFAWQAVATRWRAASTQRRRRSSANSPPLRWMRKPAVAG